MTSTDVLNLRVCVYARRALHRLLPILLGALLWTLTAGRASAESTVLGLYVDPAVLSPSALEAALEAELGMSLELLPAPEPGRLALLVEPLGEGGVRITLEGGDGRRVERDAPLLDHEAQGVETVTFLASNMLRNEAQGLLRELNVAPPNEAPPAPEPRAKVPEASSDEDSLTRSRACRAPVGAPLAADFLPFVGMSSTAAGRSRVRAFSFGVLGSYARGVRGFSLSGLVSVQRESLCGVQVSGIANVVQGGAHGLQLSLVNVVMYGSSGATLGLLNTAFGAQHGFTVGLANLGLHDHLGASVGLFNMNLGDAKGFNGGLVNFTGGDVSGAQIAVVNFAGRDLEGAQLGAVNVALGRGRGAQIGLANVAGKDAQVQLGLVNYAEKIRAPVGLLSIVKNGRTDLDVWGPSESGAMFLGVAHGGERVHNLYYLGARTGSAGQRFMAALGIGVRAVEHRFFRLDIDAMSEYIYRGGAFRKPTFQQGFRVPLTFMVKRGIGIMGAPSYHFFFSEDVQEQSQAPFGKTVFSAGKTRIEGFPGFAAGVRFELPSATPRAR